MRGRVFRHFSGPDADTGVLLTTFTLSPIGLLVGNRFGLRYKSKAELVGGLVLIGIGLKILLEGLGLFG